MNIPLTPQTNPRILAYCRILQFFQENPFEESFCGLKKYDALSLVQTYLDQNAPGLKVNLLRNSDLLSAGKNILTDAVTFGNQTTNALNYLTSIINTPQQQTNLSFSSNSPSNIQNLVEIYEREVLKMSASSPILGRGEAWKSGVGRRVNFRKRWENQEEERTVTYLDGKQEKKYDKYNDILARELLRLRNEKLEKELESSRKIREQEVWEKIGQSLDQSINQAKNSPQTILGQTISGEPPQNINKIQNIIIDAIDDTSGEEKFWDDTSASLLKPVLRQSFGQITPDEREKQLKDAYAKKIQDKFAADTSLAHLSQNTGFINEVVDSIPATNLVERSYLKFVDKKLSEAKNIDEASKGIGGLLFGKLSIEAGRATEGIGLNLKNRSEFLGDAVAETYFELQAKGLNVTNMSQEEINKILFEKLEKKFKTPISQPSTSDFDISLEAKQIANLNVRIALANNQKPEDIHSIPIPGLIFLDKFARTEIIANKDIFEMLKIQKSEEVIDKYQLHLQHYLHLEEDRQKPLSQEEKFIINKYLKNYQKIIQKSPALANLIRWNASLYSLRENPKLPKWLGGITLPIPKAYLWGYSKAFLVASFSDPTIMPLAFATLASRYVMGSIGLSIKSNYYVKAIDGIGNFFGTTLKMSRIPIVKQFGILKNLFYVKEHGMPIITWLHPLHAGKAFLQETGKKILQKTVNKTVAITARILGKEAMERLVAKMATSTIGKLIAGGIPIIGSILALFGFLWDFVFPEWLKKILKVIVGGIIVFIGWLIGLIVGIVGPLALLGIVVGAIIGGLFGPGILVGMLVGGAIGFAAQTLIALISGNLAWVPVWFQGFVGGLGQALGSIGQWLGGVIKGVASGLTSAWGVAGVAQMAFVSVATVAGVGAAGFVSVMIITTAVWTPLAPGAVPGGLIAQDFQVRKFVQSNPLSACEYKIVEDNEGSRPETTKCPNDVTNASKNTTFTYTIQIQAQPGKTISNIQIEDKVTVLAQGPTIVNPPKVNTYTIDPPTNLQDEVNGKTIPDGAGNNTLEIQYKINLQDEKFQNSIVANLVKVTANGQSATNGATFTIGTPPATCPILAGSITCGSLGSTTTSSCHGSDSYWDYVKTNDGLSSCSYRIPIIDRNPNAHWGNIALPKNFTSPPNGCYDVSKGVSDYGFALDIKPTIDNTVYFPWIKGEDSISWELTAGPSKEDGATYYQAWYSGTGSGETKTKTYSIYVTHLKEGSFISKGKSGEILGSLCTDCFKQSSRTHLHIELGISQLGNTEYVRPEDYLLCQ